MSEPINLLNRAIGVLKRAKSLPGGNVLDMDSWLEDEGETTIKDGQKHFCGTAACICGYMVFEESELPPPRLSSWYAFDNWLDKITEDSYKTSREFEKLLGQSLGQSIWMAEYEERRENAEASKFFTEEELQHPHLNSNSSLESAIDYLELISKKWRECDGNY